MSDRAREIERAIAEGRMNAAQVFTQMLQLAQAARAHSPNLSTIAQKKLDQMGATVHGVLVKNEAGAWAAVSDAGRVMWLDDFEGKSDRQAPTSGEVEPVYFYRDPAVHDENDWRQIPKETYEAYTSGKDSYFDRYEFQVFDTHPPAKVPKKEALKAACTDFFYWWYNQPGSNTQQGFDEWFRDVGFSHFTTPTPATTPEAEWVEWFGGDQPVPDGTIVELKLRGGCAGSYPAEKVDWKAAETSFDIISYRVVEPTDTPPQEQ